MSVTAAAFTPEDDHAFLEATGAGRTSPPARKLDIPAILASEELPIPYRVHQFAADGYVTVLAAHGGEGKSLLATALAIGVAHGSHPGGLQCAKGRSLIFDGENGERLITRRYKLANGPHSGVAIYEATGLNLATDAQWIIDTIHTEDPQFVVLDSFRTLAPSMAENDGDTVLPVTTALRRIARETNVALFVLHHRPKSGPGYRGSSVLRDQVDALFVLGREPNDPQRKTRRYLHCDPARDGKMRFDLEPDQRWINVELAGGLLTIDPAEPYGDNGQEPTRTQTCTDEVLAAIADGQLNRSAIATLIGRKPTDGTVGRALAELVANGTLTHHDDRTYSLALPDGNNPGKTAKRPLCQVATTPIGGGNGKANTCQPPSANNGKTP